MRTLAQNGFIDGSLPKIHSRRRYFILVRPISGGAVAIVSIDVVDINYSQSSEVLLGVRPHTDIIPLVV